MRTDMALAPETDHQVKIPYTLLATVYELISWYSFSISAEGCLDGARAK